MSRHAQVVTVRERPDLRPGGSRPPPVSATATLAWAVCRCGETLTTVVRPAETAGDVMDTVLRAAGWDPARDRCPACVDEDARRCPVCRRDPAVTVHRAGCSEARGEGRGRSE